MFDADAAERIESQATHFDFLAILRARARAAARERDRREWLRGWAIRLHQAEMNSPVNGPNLR